MNREYRQQRTRRARRLLTVGTLLALAIGASYVVDPQAPDGRDGAGAAEAATSPTPSASVAVPDDRPNIVLVMTDDQTLEDLRWMRRTRRLLGGSGTTFSEATSPHPLCCPARAMLLTGQYAQNNGVLHNNGRHGGYEAFDPAHTLGVWFAEAGYSTALIGKYLNRYAFRHGTEPGWTVWDPLTRGIYDYKDFAFFNDGGGESVYRNHYVTRAIGERTNRTVERFAAEDRPFLVLSWHVAPHYRFTHRRKEAPPAVEGMDRRRFRGTRPPSLRKPSYTDTRVAGQPRALRSRKAKPVRRVRREFLARIRSLQSVDRAVDSLVATLKRTGEWDDTYVFFTSDNGYSLGEHQYIGKNVLTEESLRVPLLVAGGPVRRGVSSVPATLTDLPATFADLAGVRPGRKIDGQSLAPVLTGRGGDRGFRDTTLVQTGRTEGNGWDYRGVRTRRYLYAVREWGSDAVLYDHRNDPYEQVNRVRDPAYREVRRELESRRRQLVTCAGESCNRRFGPVPGPRTGRAGG